MADRGPSDHVDLIGRVAGVADTVEERGDGREGEQEFDHEADQEVHHGFDGQEDDVGAGDLEGERRLDRCVEEPSRTDTLACSRRRDCHSAAPISPFSRCFNRDGEAGVSKMAVSPTATCLRR